MMKSLRSLAVMAMAMCAAVAASVTERAAAVRDAAVNALRPVGEAIERYMVGAGLQLQLVTQSQTPAQEQTRTFTASHFDDAGAPATPTFFPGFAPRYVCVVNETDRITWEWREGNQPAHCVLTVAAGTRTLITAAGVTVNVAAGTQPSISFPVLQNKQFRVLAQG